MEIVEAGETLDEWFRAAVHTCRLCKTKFRAGKKARAGRDYELHEMTYSRGSVGVKCPHCGVALWLSAPVEQSDVLPLPYVPVPYPVFPYPVYPYPTWPQQPWWLTQPVCGDIVQITTSTGQAGITVGNAWNSGAVGVLSAHVAPESGSAGVTVSGAFEILN